MAHNIYTGLYEDINNTIFTAAELTEIDTIRKESGLNLHDFILDAARLYRR